MHTENDKEMELLKKITMCSERLLQLKPHLSVSDIANNLYNRVLIERAVHKKTLNECREGFFRRFLKAVKKANPSSREVICDYFR